MKITHKRTKNLNIFKKEKKFRHKVYPLNENIDIFGAPLPPKPYDVNLAPNYYKNNNLFFLIKNKKLLALKAYCLASKRNKNKNLNLFSHFDLKNFYRFFMLKLFSNYRFKLIFFEIMQLSNSLEKELRNEFLKFYFFGHSFFKQKLFFLLKKRVIDILFIKPSRLKFMFKSFLCNKSNIQNINITSKVYNSLLYLKAWFFGFFLNKYAEKQKKYNLDFILLLESLRIKINKLFLLKNLFLDGVLFEYIKASRAVKTWLYYKIRKLKKKYRIVTAISRKERQRKYYKLKEEFPKTKFFVKGKYQTFNGNILDKSKTQILLQQNRSSFVLLYVSIKLNNVFLTLTDNNSKILFKYSGGNFGFRGKKRRDSASILNVARIVALNIKRQANLNLVVIVKSLITNQFLNVILKAFVSRGLYPFALVYAYNRPVTKQKLKKIRRV